MKAALTLPLLCALLSGAPTAQAGITTQPMPPGLANDYNGVWQPAPTPKGAVAWDVITDIEVTEEIKDNYIQMVPHFPPTVTKLDGTKIRLNGYMMPMDPTERQSHFILMAYPHTCPFHLGGGPASFVEVQADFPVPYTLEPVLIEGQFHVMEDYPDGVFYKITAAQQVEAD